MSLWTDLVPRTLDQQVTGSLQDFLIPLFNEFRLKEVNVHRGNIIRLFPEKEYGTIMTSSGDEALFHNECLWNTEFADLSEGQEVEFEIQNAHKGFLAFHIRPFLLK